jgi:uncharacterized protein YbjT (DUF2867 family)
MRVLVTGANGLIGSACLARLRRGGHDVVGTARNIDDAQRRFPLAAWRRADFDRLTTPAAWQSLLTGIDAVINTVGVFQQGARDDIRRVHVEATAALFEACAHAGIRRVIHISAIGADAAGPTDFARTKAEAEAHLATLDLDWVVLRPAVVLAPVAHGGTALLRGIAAFPWVTPVVRGASRVQIVGIDDLTETVARALEAGAPARVIWDLAHPQPRPLVEIVLAIRDRLGFPPRRVLHVPAILERCASAIADGLGWLGWRSPARSTAISQLAAGMHGDPGPWLAATGIRPQDLPDILAGWPAGIQDRWFARLYLLKPLALGGLSVFWIGTGVVALGPGWERGVGALLQAGLSRDLSAAMTVVGAITDIVLGLGLIFNRSARSALLFMLLVTAAYLVLGSWLTPWLWTDPLGPLLKTMPIVLANLFALAIIDER